MNENKDIISTKSLAKRADHYASQSLSPNTRKCYERDWKMFHHFCVFRELDPLPADPETVCLYAADMAESKMTVATIVRRMTSITAIHEASGQLSPVKNAKVSRVIQGIKREHGAPPASRKAISWDDLQKMLNQCDCMMLGARDSAVLALGWASALRRSELVALNIGDLEFSENGLIVTVRRSKTDKEGHGAKIGIPRSKGDICPVKLVEKWINRISQMPLEPDEPLFRNLGVKARGKWWYPTIGRMKGRTVSTIVKQYAKYARLNWKQYAAHSLRRGLATEAGAHGIPERVISRHTRHQSMKVLRGYIEDGSIWSENPLPAIYAGTSSIPRGQ